MAKKIIMGIILLALLSSSFMIPQEKEQKLELPQLTMEQRWHRTVGNLAAFIIGHIIYAKSKGETAADYGTFLGELHALSWNKKHANDPAYLVRGISRNFQMLENFNMEILSESETKIEARMNRAWDELANPRQHRYGVTVTVEEFNRFFEKKWEAIADYLGLVYKQELQKEWIYFTVSIKE